MTWFIVWLLGVAAGYVVGQGYEWHRVVRYLRFYEDTKVNWWVVTGVVMDEHHKKPGGQP